MLPRYIRKIPFCWRYVSKSRPRPLLHDCLWGINSLFTNTRFAFLYVSSMFYCFYPPSLPLLLLLPLPPFLFLFLLVLAAIFLADALNRQGEGQQATLPKGAILSGAAWPAPCTELLNKVRNASTARCTVAHSWPSLPGPSWLRSLKTPRQPRPDSGDMLNP